MLAGASGFISQVSMCEAPPPSQIKIVDLALPVALEGAGVLGGREHGEPGEQGKAGQPHLVWSVTRSWGASAITTCNGEGREG